MLAWNGSRLFPRGCHHPGTNTNRSFRFLYVLIVAMDANFRLKNLMRSSLKRDPGLHTGFAYFPEDAPYQKHILKYATQKDVSSERFLDNLTGTNLKMKISMCSGFKTLANAETQFSAGLRSMGIGMCICTRHKIVRAGGVGDLQKGER